MKSFPMFVRTTGRRVVIAGGGEQAAQKARLMLKTDAELVLAAPALDPELAALVANGRAVHCTGEISPALFRGAAMAFLATGCPAVDVCLHALARVAGCPVNVVDRPELCDLTTPSLVDRDPVVVAIGTEGTAPVLARQIKTRIEEMLPPTLGGYAALAGRLRGAVAQAIPRERRRRFWSWVFDGPPRAAWGRGAEREAGQLIKDAIARTEAMAPTGGSIAFVGAGPGAADLLTLRAVQRLQDADVIFYDRLVDPSVLELARRDAERVFVGKHVGAHAWPQERICGVIVAAAREGRRVVRLKSGDPGIFGRLTEELDAARAADIAVEIVPGVTAVSAAGAAAGASLTARGVSDTLVLTTGMRRSGGNARDCLRHAGPGTTTAIYMGVAEAANIVDGLMARGLPPNAEVLIGHAVSTSRERCIRCSLDQLVRTLEEETITGVTILMFVWPRERAMTPAPVLPRSTDPTGLDDVTAPRRHRCAKADRVDGRALSVRGG
ncbi:siroheme synthase CysG [Ponticoccus alexandrii]|uniref:Uroporphyrinogen-III C-methyltransferase n=1 Tax=Ponticoccus alexandrii TaxID=1943633 RepID=A0ABX7FEB0_9RHOB|nr:siroheme synthase CysG [Ponticoccus alexandrii]QRF68885.1 uroporphyrinogen-III C-methyltransferase [Ponticoccus alexandrii]